MKPLAYKLIAIATILETIGDVAFAKDFKLWGFLAYSVGSIAWLYVIPEEGLAKALILFTAANAICGCIMSWTYLKTPFTWVQVVALLLAVASAALVETETAVIAK